MKIDMTTNNQPMLRDEINSLVLDIDYLRSFNVVPNYFGLGFIQLKIQDNSRLHFYHSSLPVLADEPHTHRYGFYSHIMQGRFEQTLYNFSPSTLGTHYMEYEDCKPGNETLSPPAVNGTIDKIYHADYQPGDHYRIEANTLHTVKARGNAITYLVRDEPFHDFAGVVREHGAKKVCPFSEPIDPDRCWGMIEDMLAKKSNQKRKLGYHVRDIPKGKVGEASKIVEEAYEILDAHEQGVKIMAQLEMSDLYGALDRYRKRHHPEITMDDINDMYRVTRRAFDNGKRK